MIPVKLYFGINLFDVSYSQASSHAVLVYYCSSHEKRFIMLLNSAFTFLANLIYLTLLPTQTISRLVQNINEHFFHSIIYQQSCEKELKIYIQF